MHRDAKAFTLSDPKSYRNFYFVTRLTEFLRLKKLHCNAVLQAKTATDNGSLSVYLAHRDYVNVEAGYDQLRLQTKMLKLA